MKADREGFVSNEAHDALVWCIRLSLQWFVLHYDKFLLLHETEALREAEKEFRLKLGEVQDKKSKLKEFTTPLVEQAVSVLSKEATRINKSLTDEEKKDSEERVEAASKVIQRSFTRAETYLGMLRAVASTGALMFVFAHEIKGLVARLDTHANTLSRLMEKIPAKDRTEFRKFAQSLRDTRDRFDDQIKLFGNMAQKTKDTEHKEIYVKNTVIEVIEGFEYLIEHYDFNAPIIDVPSNLKTGPMLGAELFSIIVNLVSNAIKANLAGNGKNILIQGGKENGKTVMRVLDDGMGLSKDHREEVFTPLTSDLDGRLYEGLQDRIQNEDLASLGRGSGLGLDIVRGIAETYGGRAHFIDAEPPWKTCIEVVLA